MKKALEVRIFYLLIIQLNHSTSRIQITSLLVLMCMFFAHNVTLWSTWGRSAYQITMNATKEAHNAWKTRGSGRKPGVDIHADSGPSVQTVGVLETVAEVPATNEGRGSRKRRTKHPTTLYKCNCGENISGSEVEQGEGLVEYNKAGCETRWVSLQL